MAKKQVPLRLSEKLYNEIAAWAEDDFRSVNGQIEYLLTECVRQRKKNGNTSLSTWMSRLNSISDKLPRIRRFLRAEDGCGPMSGFRTVQTWNIVGVLLKKNLHQASQA